MRAATALVTAAAVSLLAGAAASGTSGTPKVAYITDFAAAADPHDLRGTALLGFQRAVKRFRVDGRVLQFDPKQGAAPTLELLARQHYGLVIVGEVRSPFDVNDVLDVARRFPRTKFVLADWPFRRGNWPANVQGSRWRVEEPAYVAGYLAGLVERRRPGPDVVGSVGGFPIGNVDTFIAGFEAGAKAADPDVRVIRQYAYDFLNTAKCRRVALGEIAAGAGVVFNVAGTCGLGTVAAAREKGVWAVGVDVDQSFLGPQVLTSVLKHFDVQMNDVVAAFVAGTLKTGSEGVWDLGNGAVGLGPVSPKVPRSILTQLDRVRARIVAGAVRVPTKVSPASA
jgi:basic membrane protein A